VIGPDLALVAVMAVWGSSFPLLRSLLGGPQSVASPMALLAARMALSSALLLGWLLARRELRASRELIRDGLLCGALLAAGFVLQTEGLQHTSASRSGFLTGLLVVFVPVLDFAIFRRRPRGGALLGIALAFAGMTLLSGPWRERSGSTLLGDALTVGCAAIFAGHILALGRVARRHPVLPLLLLQLACVAAAAALLGPAIEPTRLPALPRLWLGVGYLALFCTLLAFGVQTWAQRHTTALRMALISALEPVFAALWAALLLGERLSGVEMAGAALIVAGVGVGEITSALAART